MEIKPNLCHKSEFINWKDWKWNKNDNPQTSKEIIAEIVFEKKSFLWLFLSHFSSTLENLHRNNNRS